MRAASRVTPACTTAALASVSSTTTTATRVSVAMAASAGHLEMIPGVRRLAETKRVWLLDQFGVLHDGVTAYPGAVDAARKALKPTDASVAPLLDVITWRDGATDAWRCVAVDGSAQNDLVANPPRVLGDFGEATKAGETSSRYTCFGADDMQLTLSASSPDAFSEENTCSLVVAAATSRPRGRSQSRTAGCRALAAARGDLFPQCRGIRC